MRAVASFRRLLPASIFELVGLTLALPVPLAVRGAVDLPASNSDSLTNPQNPTWTRPERLGTHVDRGG